MLIPKKSKSNPFHDRIILPVDRKGSNDGLVSHQLHPMSEYSQSGSQKYQTDAGSGALLVNQIEAFKHSASSLKRKRQSFERHFENFSFLT